MCRCTPTIRTPFCGRPGCEWPPQEPKELTVQPLPISTDLSDAVFPALMADIEARNEKGRLTYGRDLETFNGRDALLDAYEEQLDHVVYLKQLLMERAAATAGEELPFHPRCDLCQTTKNIRQDPKRWTCEQCYYAFTQGWMAATQEKR